jgi:hypothetical protein
MTRIFKKILRDGRSDRRLRWADDDADRWFRLRRRSVDELGELPAIFGGRSEGERGHSPLLSASADGGDTADIQSCRGDRRGVAAPNRGRQ